MVGEIVLDDPAWGTAVALLGVLLAVLGAIAVAAATRPVYLRMAMRNAARRPTQTGLVLAGLMVGTLILSGAFVASDSMEYLIVKESYRQLDALDELVATQGQMAFDVSVYEALAADAGVRDATDGLAPVMYISGASIFDVASGQTEAGVLVQGMDPALEDGFGTFVTKAGARVDGSDLGPKEAIINERLAKAALVEAGHQLRVYFMPPVDLANATSSPAAGPQGAIQMSVLTVTHVVRDEGKAAINNGRTLFVALPTAQSMCGLPGLVNVIKVSNPGGVGGGEDGTAAAEEALEGAISSLAATGVPGAAALEVSASKKDAVAESVESAESMKDMLVMASSFTVVAGVLLIVSIFSMLAEERRKELGISRAIGMRRTTLVRTFVFEGAVYSIVAAAMGTVMGLGVGYLLMNGFLAAFNEQFDVPFYFKSSSLLISFVTGALITIVTVAVASWRISSLNIVRSIRSLPEPRPARGSWRALAQGAALLGLGALLAVLGFGPVDSGVLRTLGPTMALLGAGLVLGAWVRTDVAHTVAGLSVLAYATWALFNVEMTESEGMMGLVVSGVLMVGGAVLALVSNSAALVWVVSKAMSALPKGRAIAVPAIAHPLNRKGRTGMTVAMFSLIIFIVMLFAIFFATFAPDLDREAGGYDLYATSSVPVQDIRNLTVGGDGAEGTVVNHTTLDACVEWADGLVLHMHSGYYRVDGEEIPVYGPPFHQLMGIGEGFASHTTYALKTRASEYGTDRDAWLAVARDPALAIIDASSASGPVAIEVGDLVELPVQAGFNGTRTFRVVGVADEALFTGLFVQRAAVITGNPSIRGDNLFLMTVVPGEDAGSVAHALEAEMCAIGLNVRTVGSVVEEYQAGMETIFQMFELFMALGLLVGVASLGVLSVRAVIERRQEIGVMRAIGYTRGMVLGTFSTEMMFVTTLGILVGLVVGVIAGYGIFNSSADGMSVGFQVPLDDFAMVSLIAYAAAAVCTFVPAWKASRTNPADAVRWVE